MNGHYISYFVGNFVARPVARGLPITYGPSRTTTAPKSSTARAKGVINGFFSI